MASSIGEHPPNRGHQRNVRDQVLGEKLSALVEFAFGEAQELQGFGSRKEVVDLQVRSRAASVRSNLGRAGPHARLRGCGPPLQSREMSDDRLTRGLALTSASRAYLRVDRRTDLGRRARPQPGLTAVVTVALLVSMLVLARGGMGLGRGAECARAHSQERKRSKCNKGELLRGGQHRELFLCRVHIQHQRDVRLRSSTNP